jgi:hypothetical protein
VAVADRRAVTWLTLGATLALVVNAGAFLGPRLLLVPSVATFVIIATIIRHALRRASVAPEPRPVRSFAWLLAVVHACLAPLLLVANCSLLEPLGSSTSMADRGLDEHFVGGPPHVYIVSASDPFVGFYVAAARAMRRPGSTGQWTILSLAKGTHRVTRTAPNELRVEVPAGMLRATFERLFRRTSAPLRPGARVSVMDGFVQVLTAASAHPTAISLTLSTGDFDDGGHVLITWRGGRLQPLELAVGQSIDIDWSPGPSGLL